MICFLYFLLDSYLEDSRDHHFEGEALRRKLSLSLFLVSHQRFRLHFIEDYLHRLGLRLPLLLLILRLRYSPLVLFFHSLSKNIYPFPNFLMFQSKIFRQSKKYNRLYLC